MAFFRTAGRRHGVEERQRIVAQVDQLDVEVLAAAKGRYDPVRRPLAEPPFAGGTRDHLDQHSFQRTLPRSSARLAHDLGMSTR